MQKLNHEIFFPKLSHELKLTKFSDIAMRFLESHGYEPVMCESELEARSSIRDLVPKKQWPVYFFTSDTTGEKDFEEFYTKDEVLDFNRFDAIGVVKNELQYSDDLLTNFENKINNWISNGDYDRAKIIELFNKTIENFNHKETGKFLDNRM